jgi:tetratricopeptide (TPR) repeat protein
MDDNTDFDTLLLDKFDIIFQKLSDDEANRRRLCLQYATLVFRRFQQKGQTQDLNEAIAKARLSLQGTTSSKEEDAERLNNLRLMLECQYDCTHKLEDLDEAILVARQLLELPLEGYPDLTVSCLNSLGNMLKWRFERVGDIEDIEEAIRLAEKVVKIVPEDDPKVAAYLSNLGTKLSSRYQRKGQIKDLENAIQVVGQAVKATPKDHPRLGGYLDNLGIMLSLRYERTGKMEDLDEAIKLGQRAVEAALLDRRVSLPRHLSNLGSTIELRYAHTGKMEDLEWAIQVGRQAVDASSKDDPNLVAYQNNLETALGRRYESTGKMEDLEEAIQLGWQVVEATPKVSPDLTIYLNNLGNMLGWRYERTGKMENLEEAIYVGRQAIEATPESHPYLAACVSNLGIKLSQRYERLGEVKDLEDAIGVTRQGVDATPLDSPDLAGRLNTYAVQLGQRHKCTGNKEDLDEAIKMALQAVNAVPENHFDCATYLTTWGNKLENRYEYTKKIEDLEEAIQVGKQAVDATLKGHPDLSKRLINLGRRLKFLHINPSETLKLFWQAWNCLEAPPLVRIQAATELLNLLETEMDYESAYKLSIDSINLLPRLHNRYLSLQDQQYVMSLSSGLATQACSLALQTGESPADAVALLEQGRGVILGLLMHDQSDIAKLKAAHSTLYTQYENLHMELNKPFNSALDQKSQQTELKRRYDAENEMDKMVIEIRNKPGFEDFLQGPSGGELQEAASGGPIVVINVSDFRCDAIIVERHQVRSLPLPQLSSNEIREKALQIRTETLQTLHWLWDVVAGPILNALGFTLTPGKDNWPRVWWISTGLLSEFPIHAAGRHGKGTSESVLDRVMSTYSSSIKAIIHGRRHHAGEIMTSMSNQALLVAMEHTPGNSSILPFATKEVAMLRDLCKSMAFNPIEPGRSKQDVISHLPNCEIFHFAGHGYTDNDDPLKSHLLLGDGKRDPLTVAALLEMNLRERPPFLAYLSACGTGRIRDERFFDESVHLISACQLAGFRHVIGTLWEVIDELCVDMARMTYEGMRDGNMTDNSICLGLHNATRELRGYWLDTLAITGHGNSSIIKVDASLEGDKTESWNVGVRSTDQWKNRVPRDVLCDDDEEATAPLHWVPYVHFGV